MGKGWVGFDLDGTLACYTGWQGPDKIGEPIQPMLTLVKDLIAKGTKVKIITARVCSKNTPEFIELAKEAIEEWCLKYIGKKLPVTAEKDFAMIEFYDDRAITVEYNTGKVLVEKEDLL